MDSNESVQISLSYPPSASSSRSPSLAPSILDNNSLSYHPNGYIPTKKSSNDFVDDLLGLQRDDLYDTTLSWWRAGVRRKLVATVQLESRIVAKMQEYTRTPWLDAYFIFASILGTHTFFMIILPALFFFGYDEIGRGLFMILGLGIYFSSVAKDLFCSPRPFAPPVTRLTIGSHHLEYGFPSTHSTNSVSIALLFFSYVHRLATKSVITKVLRNSTTEYQISADNSFSPIISPKLYIFLNLVCFLYVFSVVFGRLYTGMHSFTDCIAGSILGALIWWGYSSWTGIPLLIQPMNPLNFIFSFVGIGEKLSSGTLLIHLGRGLGADKWLESWIQRGGWEVPLILIPLTLLAVHHHPQPVDDCPCFEDAIAMLSVVLGGFVSRWAMCYSQAASSVEKVIMPGSGWILESGQWIQAERGWNDVLIWWTMAALKMSVGIFLIFVWRILAKSTLHLALPPIFRLLARTFSLPHRRFYTPATEYKSFPSEFHSPGVGGGFGLHPIPSVVDLPNIGGVATEVGGIGSGVAGVSSIRSEQPREGSDLKNRMAPNGLTNPNGVSEKYEDRMDGLVYDKEKAGKDGSKEGYVKHYDADVLTKVIVYAGIGALASEILPLTFEILGWGIESWVPS